MYIQGKMEITIPTEREKYLCLTTGFMPIPHALLPRLALYTGSHGDSRLQWSKRFGLHLMCTKWPHLDALSMLKDKPCGLSQWIVPRERIDCRKAFLV